MKLEAETYRALKALLLGLPGWATDASMREALITDALYGHPVLTGGRITFTQNGDTQATKLIEACAGSAKTMPDGRTSALCALLTEVRERGWASIGFLAALGKALGCGANKPNWRYDPLQGALSKRGTRDNEVAPLSSGPADRCARTDEDDRRP